MTEKPSMPPSVEDSKEIRELIGEKTEDETGSEEELISPDALEVEVVDANEENEDDAKTNKKEQVKRTTLEKLMRKAVLLLHLPQIMTLS